LSSVFLREATGLVREFGILDAIWTNLSLVGVFFSLTFIASTATLSGGDPILAGLIGLGVMFLMGIAFSITSIVAPRTASDYVFTSRYFSPVLGFVGNAGYYVATVPLFMGITITTIESFGFSTLFGYWGYYFNNYNYVNLAGTLLTPIPEYVVGALLTIIVAVFAFLGNRVYRTLNRIIVPLILIAVAVMFIVLATTPQSTALARLNTGVANSTFVQKVNVWGSTHNSPVPAYSNFGNTLALSAVYVVGFSYIISAIYIAGEVKNVKKNMPIAILGTLLITLTIFAGSTILSYQAFGYNFLSNLYTLTIFNPASSSLPFVPYINFLAAAIANNLYVGSFIILVTIIQLLWYQTNAVFVGGRLLLSYSFDRIMPSFMGDVSERYHAPTKAMIVSLIIGLIAGLFFVLPFSAGVAFLLSSAAVAIILVFPILVVAIALLIYRTRKKAEFETSAIAHTYLGGPLYYLAAVVTILYAIYGVYAYVTVPGLLGGTGTEGYEVIVVPIIILFVIYYVARWANLRKGVQFDKIFTSIPPE
jgi:amino acid transporter